MNVFLLYRAQSSHVLIFSYFFIVIALCQAYGFEQVSGQTICAHADTCIQYGQNAEDVWIHVVELLGNLKCLEEFAVLFGCKVV